MKHKEKRNPLSRRIAIAALLSLLLSLCLILTGAESSQLPDSVRPCQPCHDRAAGDQVGEWLASPYSEAEGGRGCIDCHREQCSGSSGSRALAEHRGRVDLQSLREALLLRITANCSGEAVNVEVAISNVGVGHLLPSTAGGRILILEVAAQDREQALLPWPAGSIKLQLPPFATEVNRYRFVSPHSGPVHLSARLVLNHACGSPLKITEATTVCSLSGEES